MLNRISLINFQSHKKSVLELHPYVNVIVGETDSGKSAILRALYWLVFGRPSGDLIRRWGAVKNTKVSVLLKEGILISKIRGNKENCYRMSEEVYKGFGRNVPDAIVKTLNMTQINFMRQMDPPFLFAMSSGEVAAYLNKLVDLDIIGTSLSNISKMTKQAEKDTLVHESSIENFQKQLNQFNWISDAEKDIEELEKLDKRVQRRKKIYSEFSQIVEFYERIETELSQMPDLKKADKYIDSLLKSVAHLQNIKHKRNSLRSLISNYLQAQEALDMQRDYSNAEKLILKIQKNMSNIISLKQQKNDIEVIINNIEQTIKTHKKICCEYKSALLLFAEQMPTECPLCGHVNMKGGKNGRAQRNVRLQSKRKSHNVS